jgi:hypothetical protein
VFCPDNEQLPLSESGSRVDALAGWFDAIVNGEDEVVAQFMPLVTGDDRRSKIEIEIDIVQVE